MKRGFILCSLVASTLALFACSDHNRVVAHGFVNEPLDSIVFDLKDNVLPASEIHIWSVNKCNGYLYFWFHEQSRSSFNASHSFLMAASEDNLLAKYVPLPDSAGDFSSISVNDDTLVIKLEDERRFGFDPQKWEWSPYLNGSDDEGTLYPGTNGKMKYTEWHSGQRVIKLYDGSYGVRLIMY